MTVKEIMEQLSKANPNAEVYGTVWEPEASNTQNIWIDVDEKFPATVIIGLDFRKT